MGIRETENQSTDALAISRELCAYVIAADLVGLDPTDDATFKAWLDPVRYELMPDGRSLISTHERRPNNWGTHAGASRAAAAIYLDDWADLARCADVFKGWLGDRSSYAFRTSDFGGQHEDLSWQCDAEFPVPVNPLGCFKDGCAIDGALPEEMRRIKVESSSSFACPFPQSVADGEAANYAWGALGSASTQAVILRRQGYDTPFWSNNALQRAGTFLHNLNYTYPDKGWWPKFVAESRTASSDDLFGPWLLNWMFGGGTFPASTPVWFGKQMGWTDWTHPGLGGGGCPFADTRTASGWQVENSILGRSLSGRMETDFCRLRAESAVVDGRLELRIREDEQELTTLDEVGLLAVDHDPELKALIHEGRPVLARPVAAPRVRTREGTDVTALLAARDGRFFSGKPGDVLYVENLSRQAALFEPDPIEKQSPGLEGFRAYASSKELDQAVLTKTGISIEVPDGSGGWVEVQRIYPREHSSSFTVAPPAGGIWRMVFVGSHRLDHIGCLVPAEVEPNARHLGLVEARHSRLGDVRAALRAKDGATIMLQPQDQVNLAFEAVPLGQGQVRDLFLVAHGVYTSAPRTESAGIPLADFALAQNRPNPFARTTTIHFSLPERAALRLEVFDLQGRRTLTLAEGEYAAGHHSVEGGRRDGGGLEVPPGVYVYRIAAGRFREEKKMVLLPR